MHMGYGRGWGSWSCIFQNEIPHTTLFSWLSQVLNCCIKYQIINWFAIAAPCVHSWHSIESVHIFYPLLCWFIFGDLGAINWVRINSCDATLIELVSCLWLGPKNIYCVQSEASFYLVFLIFLYEEVSLQPRPVAGHVWLVQRAVFKKSFQWKWGPQNWRNSTTGIFST